MVGGLRPAEPQLGGAELEEHVRARFRQLGLGASQPRDRRRRRAAPQRLVGHAPQQLHARGVARRLGVDELGRGALLRGQDQRRPRMGLRALVGADVGVDGLAHDRVRELELSAPA